MRKQPAVATCINFFEIVLPDSFIMSQAEMIFRPILRPEAGYNLFSITIMQ